VPAEGVRESDEGDLAAQLLTEAIVIGHIVAWEFSELVSKKGEV
jgi:hypothetical protein